MVVVASAPNQRDPARAEARLGLVGGALMGNQERGGILRLYSLARFAPMQRIPWKSGWASSISKERERVWVRDNTRETVLMSGAASSERQVLGPTWQRDREKGGAAWCLGHLPN